MYALDIDTLFIEIPRTGMRSLERALQGFSRVSHVGHYTTQRFLKDVKKPPSKYVAVVRNPIDRLLSAINFSCRNKNHVDQAFSKLLKEGYSTEIIAPTCFEDLEYVYAPQTAYLDANVDYKLHRFDDMNAFYTSCGINKTPPHDNKSSKQFDMDYLKTHPLFEDVMQVYQADVELYNKLTPSHKGETNNGYYKHMVD
jgi:hypothetical protein